MTVRRAAQARARALVVPVLMSAPMWLVIGELALGWCGPVRQLGRYGPAALTLVIVAVAAAAADTLAGERWLARVFLRARAPRLHQRHTLAPVAHVLLQHGAPRQQLALLVGPGNRVNVTALGRRTVECTWLMPPKAVAAAPGSHGSPTHRVTLSMWRRNLRAKAVQVFICEPSAHEHATHGVYTPSATFPSLRRMGH